MFAEFFTPEQIAILTQIIFIDLVLAGDNAIIIGMVASKFPVEQRKKVIFWGIGGAVILRIILTLLTAVSKVSIILKITAPPIPQKITFFLCSTGNLEATIPIIIALSPAKTKSIKII